MRSPARRDGILQRGDAAVHTGALIAGRYRVEAEIGSGGMGIVWRARDEMLGRRVAVKRAHPAADARRLGALAREARLAGGVQHPNVVTLYDMVEAEGVSWLVMEYVPARDLAGLLESDGVLPPDDVARIGCQLAGALAAVHEHGIVHGDVKPGNVLITGSGDAKLTDFGVARAIWADETLTDSGLVHGSPAFLAPEVARGADPLPASDVFSLGATLFAASEGVSPLGTGQSPLAMVWRAASGHITRPRMPGALGAALAAMLRPDPADRPDAAGAKALIERHVEAAIAPEPRVRRRVLWPYVALVTAAVAAVSATVAVLSVISSSGEQEAQRSGPDSPVTVVTPPASAISDPRSADPCGLLDPGELRRFGGAELTGDYGNFNRCDVLLQRDGEDIADVQAVLEKGVAPEPGPRDRVERRGTVRVMAEPADGDECDRVLVPSGGGFVAVSAKRLGRGRIDLCAAATAASDHAAKVLGHGPVPRRVSPPPAGSLAGLNACSLVGTAALTRVPGLDTRHPRPGYGGWECRWAGSGGGGLDLRFDRNPPLTAEDGRPARLGDHRAFVTPGGEGQGSCQVQVVHRVYTDTAGRATAELLFLVLYGSRTTDRLCAQASALAADAAAKLPPV
jgi:hypothetical protein